MSNNYVGKPLHSVLEDIRRFHPVYQIIKLGAPSVLQDSYVPGRLTVYVDETDTIKSTIVG